MNPMSERLDLQARVIVNRSCFGLNIQRAARVVAKKFDDAFRSLGINHWQFGLLMTIGWPNGLSVNELARALGVDRTTITANVKPLERAGLLTVRVDEEDNRSRRIELTEAGEEVLKQAFPIWQRMNAEIGQVAGPRGGQELLDSLGLIAGSQK